MIPNDLLLQKLAEWRPDTPDSVLTVEQSGSTWRASFRAERIETLGGSFSEIVLTRTADFPLTEAGSATALRDDATRIADRVTGLLEPLRLIEVDGDRSVALLRSEAPARRGNSRLYYEVLRNGDGRTSVLRYEAEQGSSKRRSVPFTLTHEAVAKLVADLTV